MTSWAALSRPPEPVDEDNNTLSFFMSDNGYLWDENYIEGKLTPYTYSLRVPLFMRWPRSGPRRRNEPRLVSTSTSHRTIVDAAKLISLDPTRP